jgi:CheY-like chemotaxis protein
VDVLIADDDAGTRLLLRSAVERLGHRCTVAEDGRAGAVGYVVKGAPDDEIVRTIRSSARW